MTDLDTKLRSVDRVREPDVWERAQRRARTLPAGGEDLPEQRPPTGQRVAAALVAFAVFGGAVALMSGAFDREGRTAADDGTTPPSPATWDATAYERTRDLEGMELLQALGAVRLGFVPGEDVGTYQEGSYLEVNGEPVPGCPPVGAPGYVLIGMGDGTFYCAGERDGEEGSDIGRRASPRLIDEPQQLLGRELALSLGLRELQPPPEGEPWDKQGCEIGTSEALGGGVFCLDGAMEPDDPDKDFKLYMLHVLLTGKEVTPQVIAETRIVLDLGDGDFDATLVCPGGVDPGGAGWDYGPDPQGITDDPVAWVSNNARGLDPALDLGMGRVPGGVAVAAVQGEHPLAYVEFGEDESGRFLPVRATSCPESGIEDFA